MIITTSAAKRRNDFTTSTSLPGYLSSSQTRPGYGGGAGGSITPSNTPLDNQLVKMATSTQDRNSVVTRQPVLLPWKLSRLPDQYPIYYLIQDTGQSISYHNSLDTEYL